MLFYCYKPIFIFIYFIKGIITKDVIFFLFETEERWDRMDKTLWNSQEWERQIQKVSDIYVVELCRNLHRALETRLCKMTKAPDGKPASNE